MSERGVRERLDREVGIMAGRLAQFLESALGGREAPAGTASFLWAVYEAVAGGAAPESWQGGPLDRRPEGPPHPLDRLARGLRLSPLEADLLLLAGMAEAHEGFASIFRDLHPRSESRPSAGLAAQLFCRTGEDRAAFCEILECGGLVAGGVLRLSGEWPFYERSLLLADRLWPVLYGTDVWPPSLDCSAPPAIVAGLNEWFSAPAARRAVAALQRSEVCTVLVTADSEDTAAGRALAMVACSGRAAASIHLHGAPDLETERLIRAHTLARGVVPVIQVAAPDGPAPPSLPAMTGYPETVVFCGRPGGSQARGGRPLIHVPADRLPPAARIRMWQDALPELAAEAPLLAARYPVEPAVAAEIARDLACLERLEHRRAALEDLGPALRARLGMALAPGVKLIRPQAGWDDLVLPEERVAQLREAADRLRWQARVLDEWGFLKGRPGARGLRMLFAGPPGTGKTLAAEVLARTLDLDLLFVDIASVVSKWMGETEKNLAAVFDSAERAQSVLFFDEADALFSRRTEVSDAHDRYSNLETAFMLSRLERFEGLAILATNLRQNIDPAFLRRIEFAVDFDEPDRAERTRLWRCHIPKDAPLAPDVDIAELGARYPVVGGLIRNAAVAAGFLAAADGGVITRNHMVRALKREYEKSGRAFPEPAASHR